MKKNTRICLDAGHYGKYNRSPAVAEYYESDMTWKLHKKLKAQLEGYGFEVRVTREKKAADRALFERGFAAKGCDLFISIHSNAAGSRADESVDRVDVYAPISGKGHDIARKLADVIAETMGTKQKGYVKSRKGSSGNDYYGVIRGATAAGVPGLLVEHSFHTCTRSAKWLLEAANLDRLAAAEARILAEYYGMTGDAPEKPYELGDRTLTKGMTGPDVKQLKDALTMLGYGAADDEFDAATEAAVNAFKADNGLETDGKAGSGVARLIGAALAGMTDAKGEDVDG